VAGPSGVDTSYVYFREYLVLVMRELGVGSVPKMYILILHTLVYLCDVQSDRAFLRIVLFNDTDGFLHQDSKTAHSFSQSFIHHLLRYHHNHNNESNNIRSSKHYNGSLLLVRVLRSFGRRAFSS
jgi:hypothetical protein